MFLIGHGIDYHNLIKKKSQITLGGYTFNSEYSIVAHSDGDVILHAISNAILGAIQRGDIGDYFSDKSKNNKNLNSCAIVDYCLYLIEKEYEIINIDLTIICDKIMFDRYKADIRYSLINILNTKKINVKATRFESNSKQIACNCVLLLRKKGE